MKFPAPRVQAWMGSTTTALIAVTAAVGGAAVAWSLEKSAPNAKSASRDGNGSPKAAATAADSRANDDGRRVMFSMFCRDVEACCVFFQQLFGWQEEVDFRSPIYRALTTPNCVLGFHGDPATQLLGLDRGSAADPASDPVAGYPTLQVPAYTDVDDIAERVVGLGGTLIKGPFATFYGQWQVVLGDPEGHVVRIASMGPLPDGVVASEAPPEVTRASL